MIDRLITSTVLTLVVVPVFYALLDYLAEVRLRGTEPVTRRAHVRLRVLRKLTSLAFVIPLRSAVRNWG